MKPSRPQKIAIFASGGASNALRLQEHFDQDDAGKVVLLLSNNPRSGVFEQGPSFKTPTIFLPPSAYKDGAYLLALLRLHKVDLVVLAGYLKHIPDLLVSAFKDRILNIHPSLLPLYGGKGMYGMRVHQAVIDAGDSHSGITIHRVNEEYDQGQIIFQKKLAVAPFWSASELQQAVLQMEHYFFPQVVSEYCRTLAQ